MQIFEVPYSFRIGFFDPQHAWGVYEAHRLAGQITYLPPKTMTPPPALTVDIPTTNPWPGLAEAFVVYCGTTPGPYNSWLVISDHQVLSPNKYYF